MSLPRPPLFVCARAFPELGMEGVAHRVISAISRKMDVEAVAVNGPVWQDVPMCSLGRRVVGLHRLIVMWWRLWKARDQLRDRTLVAVGVWVAVCLLLVPGVRKGRVIVWEHSLIDEKVQSSLKLRLVGLLAKNVYPRAHAIVCVSGPLASTVRSLVPAAEVVVIPNILDTEPYSEDDLVRVVASRGNTRLVMAGTLSGTKNQAEAIRAIAELPGMSLTILGDGPKRQVLTNLARELDVGDRVEFRGHVPREEVLRELGMADVLVHTARGETFGMVYFEAAQSGVPVVAASNPAATWCIPKFVPGITYSDRVAGLVAAIGSVKNLTCEPISVRAARRRRDDQFQESSVIARWVDLLGAAGVR